MKALFDIHPACFSLRSRFGGILVLGAMVALAICVGGCAAKKPDVVLVTIDTIRADHCSAYGYEVETTPTMQRIAETGVLFNNAYAPMATTLPSHVSMFTSLYPRTHGVLKNGLSLKKVWPTLAENLKADGYRTAAIVSSYPLDSRFGIDRGFDHYDDEFEADGRQLKPKKWEGTTVNTYFDRDCRLTTRKALEWLDSASGSKQPLFLWVHYFDPHSPYEPPEPYLSRFVGDQPTLNPGKRPLREVIARYDAEIRETDDSLGALIRGVDQQLRDPEPILIIVGDHGEGLMQHGHMHHGIHVYEEAVRVPLVIRHGATLEANREIDAPASLLDLAPTILEMTGSPSQNTPSDGISLVGAMMGKTFLDPERMVLFQRRLYKSRTVRGIEVQGDKYGIRAGKWKYIEAPEEGTLELFDLSNDPGETQNLIESKVEIVERLGQQLSRQLSQIPQTSIDGEDTLTDEEAAMLRAMGYIE